MKQLIDETVILRYLLDDDKRHSKQAAEIIATGQAYTYPEIIARVAITLRDTYRVPRSQIGFTLVELLDDVFVVDEDVVRYAARLFGSSMLDFVDCMLVAHNAVRGEQIVSYDKPLLKRMLKM